MKLHYNFLSFEHQRNVCDSAVAAMVVYHFFSCDKKICCHYIMKHIYTASSITKHISNKK